MDRRRRTLILLALTGAMGAAAGPAGATSASAEGSRATPPGTSVGVALQRCLDPVSAGLGGSVGRELTFRARMDGMPSGAERLSVAFRLQVRGGVSPSWTDRSTPEFDRPVVADAGAQRLSWVRRVRNLPGPAEVRVLVRFRWLDAEGHVVAAVTRRTTPCEQTAHGPDVRPLTSATLRGLYGQPAALRVTVVNDGDRDAPATVLAARSATVPGRDGPSPAAAIDAPGPSSIAEGPAAVIQVPVPPIPAGRRATVTLPVPACTSGGTVILTADAHDTVEESDEDGNVLATACP